MRPFNTMRPHFLVSLLALCLPVAGNDAVAAMVAMLQGVVDDMDTARHERDLLCTKDMEISDSAIETTSADVERYKSKTSQLEATIVRDEADSDALRTQIQKDTNTLTAKDAEKKAAQSQRAADNEAFNKKQGEQSEIIQTIRGAIAALDQGGQSLLQGKPQEAVMRTIPAIKSVVAALSITSKSAKQLDALVQASTEGDDDFGEYVSRGQDVMTLLHGLLEDGSAAYTETKATEQNDLFEHNRMIQELNAEMQTLQDAITQNKQALAAKKASISADTASHEVAQTNLNNSIALLATLKQDGALTDKECKDFLQDAQEQINSMNEAIKVLNSDSMQSAVTFLQVPTGNSFVQTGVTYNDNGESQDQARAARFLSDMADRLGSPVLAQIGDKVAAGKFDFVIRMIEDMLLKLNNIASHSDFCESQLKIDEQASTEKSQRVDRATTTFDKLTAEVQQLKTDLADAVDSQNKQTQALTALTAQRAAAQRDNSKNTRNLETVATGFDTAISALEKAGGSAAAIDQLRSKSADIKRQAIKWAALESGDDKEFKKLKGDISADIAGNQRLEKLLRKDLITKRAELAQSEAELHDLQVQLGAVQGTLATQKKDCQVSEVNDADRARRTEKEKLALQEALAILKSEGDINPGPWN